MVVVLGAGTSLFGCPAPRCCLSKSPDVLCCPTIRNTNPARVQGCAYVPPSRPSRTDHRTHFLAVFGPGRLLYACTQNRQQTTYQKPRLPALVSRLSGRLGRLVLPRSRLCAWPGCCCRTLGSRARTSAAWLVRSLGLMPPSGTSPVSVTCAGTPAAARTRCVARRGRERHNHARPRIPSIASARRPASCLGRSVASCCAEVPGDAGLAPCCPTCDFCWSGGRCSAWCLLVTLLVRGADAVLGAWCCTPHSPTPLLLLIDKDLFPALLLPADLHGSHLPQV